jgi:hypothetical protein
VYCNFTSTSRGCLALVHGTRSHDACYMHGDGHTLRSLGRKVATHFAALVAKYELNKPCSTDHVV